MEQFIPWTISGIALIVTILTFVRSGRKSMKEEVQKDDSVIGSIKESLLKVNLKLDQVCATTNETRTDIKSMNKDIQSLDNRLIVVERDMKIAFKLIDDLRGE